VFILLRGQAYEKYKKGIVFSSVMEDKHLEEKEVGESLVCKIWTINKLIPTRKKRSQCY